MENLGVKTHVHTGFQLTVTPAGTCPRVLVSAPAHPAPEMSTTRSPSDLSSHAALPLFPNMSS